MTCRDIGFVHPVTNDKPDYSKSIACPDCTAQRIADMAEHTALGLSGIPIPRQKNTFGTYKVNDNNRDAFQACRDLSSGKTPWALLMIYGVHGNGKTHLSYAACIEAIANKMLSARFENIAQLLGRMQSAMRDGEQGSEYYINQCEKSEFLALDDWGAYKESDWRNEVLERIINHRYENNLPTIVTTNINPQLLSGKIKSIFSDRERCKVVHNKDVDNRRKGI